MPPKVLGMVCVETARAASLHDINAGTPKIRRRRSHEFKRGVTRMPIDTLSIQYNARPTRKLADRAGHLKRKFGISIDQFQEMLTNQGGGCAICEAPPPENGSLHVDHDHETGEVRGLLCFSCNGGIGQFQHDPLILRAAIRYLDPRAAQLAKDWVILLEA